MLIKWCTEKKRTQEIYELLEANLTGQYISYSDFFYNRVNEKGILNEKNTKKDIEECIGSYEDKKSIAKIATISSMFNELNEQTGVTITYEKIIAFSLVEFFKKTKFAVIHDIIVESKYRSKKIGEKFLNWIEQEIKNKGVHSIFLECGINNRGAQRFFMKNGFNEYAYMMKKDI